MNPGEFISPNIFNDNSILSSIINNPSGIQFMHRYIAYLVVAMVAYIWYLSKETTTDKETKKRFNIIFGIVIFQFVIGVFTLIMHVPISLGMIHQLGALLLLLSFVYALRWITLIAK